MLRGLINGLVGCALGLATVIVPIMAGMAAGSWIVFFLAFGAAIYGAYVAIKSIDRIGRVDMSDWLMLKVHCRYSYAYDGSGIAVDSDARKVHLTARSRGIQFSREYDFSQIREWSYEIKGVSVQQSARVFGGGVAGAGHNFAAAIGDGVMNAMTSTMAQEKSGLTVKVADIDSPRWFIKFKPERNLEMELSRWMEILTQTVNK